MTVSGKTRVVGLFGSPVSHSRSPLMQNVAFSELGLDWVYVPFKVDPADVGSAVNAVRSLDFVGANVTVPLKELIAPHLDWIDPSAQTINSINTIVNSNGILKGYSTDGEGLLWDLTDKNALPPSGATVLVLGAGGSSRAALRSLIVAGCKPVVANRTRSRAERAVLEIGGGAEVIDWDPRALMTAGRQAQLIINTTTLGLDLQESFSDLLPPGMFSTGSTFYDLVYSPPVTALMRAASDAGGRAFNGLGMLVRQGALSLCHWSGRAQADIPIALMERLLALN